MFILGKNQAGNIDVLLNDEVVAVVLGNNPNLAQFIVNACNTNYFFLPDTGAKPIANPPANQPINLALFDVIGEEVVISKALLIAGQSSVGGLSQKQLQLLGVEWPPTHGWPGRILGTKISKAAAEQFLALKNKHRK